MRALLLTVAILVAPLGLPARPAHACPAPTIPVYPGALPATGAGSALPVTAGNSFIATNAPLLDIQAFYYTRMPNEGWAPVTQLPGQYIEQFDGFDSARMNEPLGVLEFSRNDGHEHVRIVADAGGYSIWVDCSD
ncbi:MAG TPA: hypothetical protein VFE37_25980 [Chloroflexota bacterium]|nr:hypothetical protein [Chloroflexota bacterium]